VKSRCSMRKKIPVSYAVVGMYVDELCGNWIDTPFWRKSFKLANAEDLKSLRSCGVRDIWIDTQKGKDTDQQLIVNAGPTELDIDASLALIAVPVSSKEPQLPCEKELDAARKILTKATLEVTSMFNEVRMGKALQVENAPPLVEEIYLSVVRNSSALIGLTRLKNKDNYTYMHSVAVCALMIALGRKMALDESTVKSLGMAGLLHDVGKMAIPDLILNKPGKLSDEEFGLVKSHPERGWEILKESDDVDDIAKDVCLHHHEKVDGTGYPQKLSADNLSSFAKMGAVCDVYDAITSNRSYKDGWGPAVAIRKMASWKEGHFDNHVFDTFVSTIGIYPVGTLVKLSLGRLGVVTDQTTKNLLKPQVKVFYSTSDNSYLSPKTLDLTNSSETIISIEDPASWQIDLSKFTEM
jgi:putative nucleotidyltransferase with HDIG domain